MILRKMIEPIPREYDLARYEIRIAERLGVGVNQLEDVSAFHIVAARIDIAVDARYAERRRKEAEAQRRRIASNRRTRSR